MRGGVPTAQVKVNAGETFYAYKIFDMEYEEGTTNANQDSKNRIWTITESNPWYAKLWDGASAQNAGVVGEAQTWFTLRKSADYASSHKWVVIPTAGNPQADNDLDTVASRQASEWLKNNIPDTATKQTIEGDGTATPLNGRNGYYLFVSSTTAGVALADSKTEIDLTKKVDADPSIEKVVYEVNGIQVNGETGKAYQTVNIGDEITFKITVNVPVDVNTNKSDKGDIVITDTSATGLAITEVQTTDGKNPSNGPITNASVSNTPDTGFTYTITENDITAAGDYTIIYKATLNGDGAHNVYANTASLKYNNVTSKEVVAKVGANVIDRTDPEDETGKDELKGSWSLLKVDDTKKQLSGAKFKIYKPTQAGKELVKFNYDDASKTYTAAKLGAKEEIDLTLKDNANGPIDYPVVHIQGLAGTIYIEETQAPNGYNSLPGMITVNLSAAADESNGVLSKESGETIAVVNNFPGKNSARTNTTWTETHKGLAIVNTTGTLLPSTGGIGTTIFYIAGAILLLGAVVVLIVRRRMNEDN